MNTQPKGKYSPQDYTNITECKFLMSLHACYCIIDLNQTAAYTRKWLVQNEEELFLVLKQESHLIFPETRALPCVHAFKKQARSFGAFKT